MLRKFKHCVINWKIRSPSRADIPHRGCANH